MNDTQLERLHTIQTNWKVKLGTPAPRGADTFKLVNSKYSTESICVAIGAAARFLQKNPGKDETTLLRYLWGTLKGISKRQEEVEETDLEEALQAVYAEQSTLDQQYPQ